MHAELKPPITLDLADTVSVQGASVNFGRQRALDGVTLTAQSGQILGLLGPSGAGKTTLMRLILGAQHADEGWVDVLGTRVPNLGTMAHVGYMPQNDAVYPDVSGEDNLRFFGAAYGLGGEALSAGVERVLALVNLAEDRGKLVGNYSGGMRKRLSLAIALLPDPSVLVLDEPTVGIDPMLRREIWDEFRRLAASGKTLIISTHVLDEIDRCDRAALLYRGRLLYCDVVGALKSQTPTGSIEELFLDAAQEGAEQ